MRYSREHKQLTQERILESAARTFRERGIAAVGIAELMQRLGLTHGGFYAHFASKDALAAAACARALARNRSRFAAVAAGATGAAGAIGAGEAVGTGGVIEADGAMDAAGAIAADRPIGAGGAGNAAGAESSRRGVKAILASYLTAEHRDNPGTGCAVAALGAEVARQPPEVRRAFTAGLESHLDGLAALLPGAGRDQRKDLAMALIAGLVGALTIARAVDDSALSNRILAATATALQALATSSSPGTRRKARPVV